MKGPKQPGEVSAKMRETQQVCADGRDPVERERKQVRMPGAPEQ